MRTVFLVAAIASLPLLARADDPPPAPTPLRPAHDAEVVGGAVHFVWAPATLSEGTGVRYELEVWSGTPDAAGATRVAQATQGDGSDGVVVAGLPYGALAWRARGVSPTGTPGDWSASTSFTTTDNVRTTVGRLDETPGGCDLVGRRPLRPGLIIALLLLVVVLVYRRRSGV